MAFLLFDNGQSLDAVSFVIRILPETTRRYYRDWKKLPRVYNQVYLLVRQRMRRMSTEDKNLVWEALAKELGCEVGEIEERMSKPWALRDLVTQRWRQWDVTIKQNRGKAYTLERVLDKILNRSDDATYVIEIAMGKLALATKNE